MPVTLTPGAEIVVRNNLRALVADLDSVEAWFEEANSAARLARVSYPVYDGTALPAIVIALGQSRRVSELGNSGDAEWQAGGELALLFFDEVDVDADSRVEDARFGGNVTAVIDELIEAAYAGNLHLTRVNIPENAWKQSSINTEDEADVAGGAPSKAIWTATITMTWGILG